MESHQSSAVSSILKLTAAQSLKKSKDKLIPKKSSLSPQLTREADIDALTPADKDIEAFQKALDKPIILFWSDIFRQKKKYEEGCILSDAFIETIEKPDAKFPVESIPKEMVHNICERVARRFRPLKIDEAGKLLVTNTVDVLEALVALGLLARINYTEKIYLIFKICDTDNDDCLSFKEIYNMCFLIEKVFSKECAMFNFDSTLLLYALANKKAKDKFRWLVRCYLFGRQLGEQADTTTASDSGEVLSEDWLISYEEFIKSLNDDPALFESFLPPPLEMKQVLSTVKAEKEYDIHDENMENFLYFRYEMNWLFRKDDHVKLKKVRAEVSKIDELIAKINSVAKPPAERYRPPGLLPQDRKLKGGEDMKNIESCYPLNYVYLKKSTKTGENNGYDRQDIDEVDLANVYLPSDMAAHFAKKNKEFSGDQYQMSKTKELENDADNKLDEERKATTKLELLLNPKVGDYHAGGYSMVRPEKTQPRKFARKKQ